MGPWSDRTGVLRKEAESPEIQISTMWGHREKAAVCKSGKELPLKTEFCHNLDLWLFYLQNCEKVYSFCLGHLSMIFFFFVEWPDRPWLLHCLSSKPYFTIYWLGELGELTWLSWSFSFLTYHIQFHISTQVL